VPDHILKLIMERINQTWQDIGLKRGNNPKNFGFEIIT
jgi:hypothetical protein